MSGPSTHASLLERLSDAEDQEAWLTFAERYGPLIRDYGRRRGLQSSDCDDLLLRVEQIGGACHMGYRSCFYRSIDGEVVGEKVFDPDEVY